MKAHFKDGLEEKCRVGATNVGFYPNWLIALLVYWTTQATDAAVQTVDEFSSSMHWSTYRASS